MPVSWTMNSCPYPTASISPKIHKEDLEKVKQAYTDLIEGRIQKVKEEYRVINHADGHKHFDWVEAQAAVEPTTRTISR